MADLTNSPASKLAVWREAESVDAIASLANSESEPREWLAMYAAGEVNEIELRSYSLAYFDELVNGKRRDIQDYRFLWCLILTKRYRALKLVPRL